MLLIVNIYVRSILLYNVFYLSRSSIIRFSNTVLSCGVDLAIASSTFEK